MPFTGVIHTGERSHAATIVPCSKLSIGHKTQISSTQLKRHNLLLLAAQHVCVFVIFVVLGVTDTINLIKNTLNGYMVPKAIVDTQLAGYIPSSHLKWS